jgi:hypothetical protein
MYTICSGTALHTLSTEASISAGKTLTVKTDTEERRGGVVKGTAFIIVVIRRGHRKIIALKILRQYPLVLMVKLG